MSPRFARLILVAVIAGGIGYILGYRSGRLDGFELGLFKTAENVMGQSR